MEIIRGSLDDISRPASSEQTGSRVSSVSLPHRDRMCPTTPFSLVVLSNDAADIQIHSSSKEATVPNPSSSVRDPGKDECHTDATDEEDEDSELQRAIEEMRRLDEILSAKICREQEMQHQRKELQAKLWQELQQNTPEGHSECAHEALNTKLFLALEAPIGTEEKEDFIPVFETQVLECEHDRDNQHSEQSDKKPDSLTDSFEVGYKDKAEDRFEGSHCGASKGMNKQKDFVKRNIELVNGEGGQVFLTQAEKRRLTELLQEIDEEEEDNARGADSKETVWAVSILTDQGYTPEPSDLKQLIDIDSKIHHLHPDDDLHSYTNLSMSQGSGSRVGWKCIGDLQPGEKVLQDIKERRGQEKRLREIQQQLEILGQGQEMTDGSPDLTEEQLLSLLHECELTERWSQDIQTNDVAS